MSREKLISLLKGAGIAGAGAMLAYALQWASSADFGMATPAVVALLSVAVNFVRKLAENEAPQ